MMIARAAGTRCESGIVNAHMVGNRALKSGALNAHRGDNNRARRETP
jgi:hypothetical protein